MRFVIVAIGTAGDVFPSLALGRALTARGGRVAFVTHTTFGPWVAQAGVEFVDLDDREPHRAMLEHPWFRHPLRSSVVTRGWLTDSMRRQFAVLEQLYRPGETIVLSPVIAVGARVFEEVHGAPHLTLLVSPMMLRSHERPSRQPMGWWPEWTPGVINQMIFRVIDAIGIDRALSGVNTFRRAHGLPHASRLMHEWWLSPQGIIGLFPDWFVEPIPGDWPPHLQLTGFPVCDGAFETPLDPEVERFLATGPPPVVVTGGSWLREPRYYRAAVEGCLRSGRRCLVTLPTRELLPVTLPADVLAVRYVPFSRVLSRAAAIVHPGGIGTLSLALAAGIPQVVIPQNFDQRDNATRLMAQGVGEWPANGLASGRRIARSLQRLLCDAPVRAACERARHRMRHDGVAAACDAIEAFAQRVQGARPAHPEALPATSAECAGSRA